MSIYEFFIKHECTKHERLALIVRLAEMRYEATLKMLQNVMRGDVE